MQLSISALATVLSGIKQLKSYMLETLCWTGGSNGIQPVKSAPQMPKSSA